MIKLKRLQLMPVAILFLSCMGAVAQASGVNFEFAPPEWQTAICLPDDPYKSLVDHEGTLLYHYGKRGREFGTIVQVEMAQDKGYQARMRLKPLKDISCKSVVVHFEGWAVEERGKAIQLEPNKDHRIVILISKGRA